MKSPLLRKYKDIYDIISKLKKVSFNPKKNSIKIMTPERSPEKSKKPLNQYQKFIQTESLKSKYKNISPKSRIKTIAYAWRHLKKTQTE